MTISSNPTFRFFLPLLVVVISDFGSGIAHAADVVVPDDFATIQAAIDGSQAGDTVIVEPGTYTENITLRGDIDVRGREAARTLLMPETTDPTVRASGISDIVFSNFTFINATIGVEVLNSTGIIFASNVFDTAEQTAIDTDRDSAVEVINNVFWNNAIAIQRSAADTQLTNNVFSGNSVTIRSPANVIDNQINVKFNCFFDNDDLKQADIDTALGTDFQIGDPLFVDTDARDFHLRQNSPCIDAGDGTDVIDNTVADMGAYGGDFADVRPFPVSQLTAEDTSEATPPPFSIRLTWQRNLSHRVTSDTNPGGYRAYYRMNQSGPPYDGMDAGNGAAPSPIDVGNVATFTLNDLAPTAPTAIAPRLLTAVGGNESTLLTWEAVPGVNGYRVHYGIESTDENQVAAGNVTELIVSGLVNGSTYRFAVSALTQATYYVAVTAVDSTQNQNESDFSVEESIEVGDANQSPRSNELTALPEFTLPYPVLPDEGGCFIATAAFGADWTAEVQALRDFRDRYLLLNSAGRWFVDQYYRLSPPVADYLRGHEALKTAVRWLLTPAVVLALFMLGSTPFVKAATFMLILSLGLAVCKRCKTSRLVQTEVLSR